MYVYLATDDIMNSIVLFHWVELCSSKHHLHTSEELWHVGRRCVLISARNTGHLDLGTPDNTSVLRGAFGPQIANLLDSGQLFNPAPQHPCSLILLSIHNMFCGLARLPLIRHNCSVTFLFLSLLSLCHQLHSLWRHQQLLHPSFSESSVPV